VVDLKDAANSGKSRDSRFLKKILTDAEIEYVTHADHPDSTLWLLWACKETAYKVIKKILPDSPFLPGRWPVVFTTLRLMDREGKVGIAEKHGVYVRCFSRAGYVHCIGSDCSELTEYLTWKVEFPAEDGNLDTSRIFALLSQTRARPAFFVEYFIG
jgi:phosphopantetheinyl transferase (holo-ACP synthase)